MANRFARGGTFDIVIAGWLGAWMQVFVSYSRQDMPLCDQVVSLAKSVPDVKVVRDDGFDETSFLHQIEAAIQTADVFLVLWTPQSVASHWVRQEALEALRLKKRIIQVLEGVALPPFGFRELNIVSLDRLKRILSDFRTDSGTLPSPAHDAKDARRLLAAYEPIRQQLTNTATVADAVVAVTRDPDDALRKFAGRGSKIKVWVFVAAAFILGYGVREYMAFDSIRVAANDPAKLVDVYDAYWGSIVGSQAASQISAAATDELRQAKESSGPDNPAPLAEFTAKWSGKLARFAEPQLAEAATAITPIAQSCLQRAIQGATGSGHDENSTARLNPRTSSGGESKSEKQTICVTIPANAELVGEPTADFPSRAPNARVNIELQPDQISDTERRICRRYEVRSPSGMQNMNVGVHGTGRLRADYVLKPSPEQVAAMKQACHVQDSKPSNEVQTDSEQ